MATVGQQLSAAREQRGYSITDVEKGTSIRALYIQAIETGDYEVVPGEVYLKGFIRNYATFVGLDGSNMVELYKQERQPAASQEPMEAGTQTELAQEKKSDTAPSLRENASFSAQPRAGKSLGWLAGLVVAVVLVAGYWWSGTSAPPAGGVQPSAASKPVMAGGVSNAATSSAANAAGKQDGVHLQALFQADCWVDVSVDGKKIFNGTAQKGQTLRWDATKLVRLTLGNAGAVQLTFNGSPQAALGKTGEVVEYEFTPQGPAKK